MFVSWISTCSALEMGCVCIVRPSGDNLAATGALRDACYTSGKAINNRKMHDHPALQTCMCMYTCTVRACMTDTETIAATLRTSSTETMLLLGPLTKEEEPTHPLL